MYKSDNVLLVCALLLSAIIINAIGSDFFPIKVYTIDSADNKLRTKSCKGKLNGEFLVLKSFIKAHDVVFDVGASIGCYTKELLSLNVPLSIYDFEPVPEIYATLVVNIKNGKNYKSSDNKDIKFFNIALSDKNSVCDFYYVPQAKERSSLYLRKSFINKLKSEKISIETMSLNDFCYRQSVDHINFLKIDTEGAEYAILRGAQDMLEKHAIDYIQFEYGGTYLDAKTTLKEICQYLTFLRYVIFKIVPDGLIHINVWRDTLEDYKYSNFFVVSRELFNQFGLMKFN